MNNIMGMVAVFIGIAIMLSVGITILSNASAGLDCSNVTSGLTYTHTKQDTDNTDPDDNGTPKTAVGGNKTNDNPNKQTADDVVTQNSAGWHKLCLDAAAQAQAGYQLMVVALIVIAAVIILIVVRML
ncbi:MAG: hypothetical protein OXQ29_04780 [Rhodospirillaceae bacterium]|nr:hypothetical protein [Rhodospirillaceae bacterium]